ncbi:DNA/RNA non-specific endonuclease [Hymenobacter sp. BT175]|uniref:DNA/RNA non-specific endonuclease n=1 Tax=Hymenobacter translucens TaxID=2886507 RepID=UPI001D0DCE89|nr:DNA/RNA non-specific endonuclease [Hymenobacter translucens]MCC2545150.1 DNA/RNA non-specific endonuclease [Hymenobacter translucens]
MRLPGSLLFSALLLFTQAACSQQQSETTAAQAPQDGGPAIPVNSAATPAGGITETFEAGSKGAYSEANETLSSGSWHFTDALIGTAEQDHKNGGHAARLRGQGRLRMNFDAPAGVRTIRISAAAYGQDPASTWELWGSVDGGRTFRRIGAPVRTSGPALTASTFTGGTGGRLRLEIRKTDGGSARLNIDDIVLDAGTGPASQPAASSATSPVAPSAAATARAEAVVVNHDDNMALGNPSGATGSTANVSNYLMVKPQYTLSYHRDRGIPNWVSWHLTLASMGEAPRQDDFRADPALPRGWYAVSPRSYSGAGFDKGHNCPSADRTTDLDANSATFLMTNMIPQAPHNNQQTWGDLEEYTRSLVKKGQEVYVVMGCYGKGGTGSKGFAATLDNGRVTVPARIWKVLVILPEGDDDLRRIGAGQAKVLAVDTPNDNSLSPDWRGYLTSVDKIEAATGLDLLSKLPVEVQARLEAPVTTAPGR